MLFKTPLVLTEVHVATTCKLFCAPLSLVFARPRLLRLAAFSVCEYRSTFETKTVGTLLVQWARGAITNAV